MSYTRLGWADGGAGEVRNFGVIRVVHMGTGYSSVDYFFLRRRWAVCFVVK